MAKQNGPEVIRPRGEAAPEAIEEEPRERTPQEDSAVVLTVEEQPETGKPTKPSYYHRKKQRKQDSAEGASAVIVMIMDTLVGQSFGVECQMNEHEKEMILPSLIRILERLDYATTRAVEKWTDPIMLAMGMAAWLGRVYRIQSERSGDDDEGRDDEPEPVGPRDDGKPIKLPTADERDNIAFPKRSITEAVGTEGITG